ncbi:Spermidine/putrescine transport system permease protein potB [Gluconacetobacter sp. SXCC-1]|uniref:ABC transporter permease subunit n=1 Tax=Komagataeibacter rhaeticus TaxID=215221 RepID=A0A181CDE6_9PROT|nr:ABC transporter permease subunit [Komagataeibacter rhaeticus]ATU71593.1 ABC transporter permease [Komagataeibacter xylinus]EGG77691.1 Spermidine/putrescine transport system permease protein potB [Gluconacetobacter sp. SXCC-1]QIP36346.1 ABC transporter permease subunit [Komagataeibacter rhaeticus]QOC46110.1 ABC transporter permease subunit [Komagataeibacter rhaeticus]WPP21285.1 ABC transporter permease subunit [Komagataeibacter rhaeticus]
MKAMPEKLSAPGLPMAGWGRRLLPYAPVLPGVLFLAVFLILPLVQTAWSSIHDPASGRLSPVEFVRVFQIPAYRQVLWNTVWVGLWCTLFSVGIGYPVAFWLATTSERTRRRALFLIMAPFWTSVLVRNFTWLVLLGRHGPVAGFMRMVGLHGADSLLFNRPLLIVAMLYVLLPMAIISMLPAHRSISRQWLDAACTMGAGWADLFWRVYMPLTLRGTAAAALLVFLSALGFFITPMLLGGRHDVLLGELIILQIDRLQNWNFGNALAVIIVLAGGIAILLTNWLFDLSGTASRRAAVSRAPVIHDRLARISAVIGSLVPRFLWPERHGGTCLAVFAWSVIAFLGVPLLAIVPMAFTRDSFLVFPPHLGTLRWFVTYFHDPLWISATLRSLRIGFGAATLAVVLSGLAAFGIARMKGRMAGLGILAFMVPLAVPPIVIALAQFGLFARVSMIATDSAIMLGHTVLCMPIVFTILLGGFRSYNWQLNQAAATLGARMPQILGHVLLPLLRPVLVAGFVAGFLTSFDELTIALFLGGGLKTTLPKQMWDAVLLEVSPLLVAVSVVMMLLITVLFVIMESMQRNRATP